MAEMAEKFSEFMATESARKERDKHQIEVNEKLLEHIEDFNKLYRPIIMTSQKLHASGFWFLTRVAFPVIIAAVLGSVYVLK
jgi:hypothetical protein